MSSKLCPLIGLKMRGGLVLALCVVLFPHLFVFSFFLSYTYAVQHLGQRPGQLTAEHAHYTSARSDLIEVYTRKNNQF